MYDVASGVRVSTTHASFPSSNAIVPRGSLGCEQAGVTRHASNDGRAWRTASRLLKKRAGSMRVFRTSERRSHSQQSVSTMGLCFCNRSREAGALLGGWLGLEEEGSDVLNAGAHLDHVGDALGLLRRDKIHDERWQISLENQHMTMTRKRRTLRSTQARYSIRHFLGSSFTGRSRNPARMISARTYLADGE